jgi:signal transduction histidine kinase
MLVIASGDRAGVSVTIRDDGRGFDAVDVSEPRPGHLGLTTMLERAELTGGHCRISSAPGAGTTVEVWLPLDAESTQGARGGRPDADRPV